MDITEILLSSDGLTNMLEKQQIEKVLLGEGEGRRIKLIRLNSKGLIIGVEQIIFRLLI